MTITFTKKVRTCSTMHSAVATPAPKIGVMPPMMSACDSHGIALSGDGVCLLCKKERLESDKGRGWKVLVAVMLVAIVMGVLIASGY